MSHFSVAVFSHSPEDVEKLLLPFDEQSEDPEYAEWEPDEDGAFNEEKGECGYFYNPNAKWDWYQIGGRFSDMLKVKDGCSGNHGERSWANDKNPFKKGLYDQAIVKDVDFSPDPESYKRALRFWEIFVEGAPLKDDENEASFFSFYKPAYFTSRYENKEAYAITQSKFSVWAFLTPDGEWFEKGEMGWFAVADDTKESIAAFQEAFEKFVAENPELYITIVDCHI